MIKVVSVKQGNNAERSGIVVNDIILKYDGIKVNSKQDLLELTERRDNPNGDVFLEVSRNGNLKYIKVQRGKLGLTLKIEDSTINNDQGDSDTPLLKANQTLRKANSRITELKRELTKHETELNHLRNELALLKTNQKSQLAGFSDYELFGSPCDGDFELIRKNYKKLSNIYHPDKGGNHYIMTLFNSAYHRLVEKKES